MTKRVVIYVRESLDEKSLADQILALTEIANQRDWLVVKTYIDQTIFSEKDPHSGAAFYALCQAAEQNIFDMVMIWSVDRIGRSLQELVRFLLDLSARKVDLYLHQQKIDTTQPNGKALFSLCGIFADFERAIIRERVAVGLKRARNQGKKLGRPRASLEIEHQIRHYREQGMGINKIARTLHVGVGLVQRVVAPLKASLQ